MTRLRATPATARWAFARLRNRGLVEFTVTRPIAVLLRTIVPPAARIATRASAELVPCLRSTT